MHGGGNHGGVMEIMLARMRWSVTSQDFNKFWGNFFLPLIGMC
jgi:hypothetical protein